MCFMVKNENTAFRICYMVKTKTWKRRNEQEVSKSEIPLSTVTITRKLLKYPKFGMQVPFWLQEQRKLLSIVNANFTLIILSKTFRDVSQTHRLKKVSHI